MSTRATSCYQALRRAPCGLETLLFLLVLRIQQQRKVNGKSPISYKIFQSQPYHLSRCMITARASALFIRMCGAEIQEMWRWRKEGGIVQKLTGQARTGKRTYLCQSLERLVMKHPRTVGVPAHERVRKRHLFDLFRGQRTIRQFATVHMAAGSMGKIHDVRVLCWSEVMGTQRRQKKSWCR